MKHRLTVLLLSAAWLIIWFPRNGPAADADQDGADAATSYSPYVGREYPRDVYFGDTHLHSSYSFDAAMLGNQSLGPDMAYRFARGEAVVANNGMTARLVRPLDFLVVSDHAEMLGLLPHLQSGNPSLLASEQGRRWHELWQAGRSADIFAEALDIALKNRTFENAGPMLRSAWSKLVEFADQYNEPGRFTALSGYEWSSTPNGNNLHRIVVFRDGADRTGNIAPFSSFDSDDPEDLWRFMASYEQKTGGSVIAIPHNANMSNGLMFAVERLNGAMIDRDYALRRARWEPLLEVTQIKGDGESHPLLSPNDEFADFGTWDKGNMGGFDGNVQKHPDDLRREYARPALLLGLEIGARLGANPFRFGMIGSTDSHTSLSTAREENFWGKMGRLEPSGMRYQRFMMESKSSPELSYYSWEQVASGYAAVWATANTRAAIFDAMRRREVYATTGPRIRLRVFAGWDFETADLARPDVVDVGYARGVPMGGELSGEPNGRSPTLLVMALKDPDGPNLDRVQIIKGWQDRDGQLKQQIYDVALADGRQPGPDGRVPDVGSTVDVATATYRNSIGDARLAAAWTDPDFNGGEAAFYYVRVIQIPSPRWTAYDAAYFGVQMPDYVPMVTRERAYSSPVWYTP